MEVRIFKKASEPPGYESFCPGTWSEIPVVIAGHDFRNFRQFLLFNMFDLDIRTRDYAEWFTSDDQGKLTAEYERLHTKELGPPVSYAPDAILDFMQKRETYLAANDFLDTPDAKLMFAQLKSEFLKRSSSIVKQWIVHRFRDAVLESDTVKFVSSDYVQYTTALNHYLRDQKQRQHATTHNGAYNGPDKGPNPEVVFVDATTLTKFLRPSKTLYELAFGQKHVDRETRMEIKKKLGKNPQENPFYQLANFR
jgi:hypothetical protein